MHIKVLSISDANPYSALPLIQGLFNDPPPGVPGELLQFQVGGLSEFDEQRADALARGIRFARADESGVILPDSVKEHVTVVDFKTQLLIDVRPCKELKYAEAAAFAGESRLGKFADWKIPAVEDLFQIPDRTRFKPAADPRFFPHIKPSFHWSATPCPAPDYSEYQFGVFFDDGDSDIYRRDLTGFVLPVRSLAAPASQ